ncbi:MAG TPA: pitrilysin family protein [Vicinamibacterales bacterium]
MSVTSSQLGRPEGRPLPTQGLAPSRVRLANGATVVARETRKTPAVAINVAIRAGSICDPADTLGATYMLSRVIDRGTAIKSAEVIADELDGRGVSLTISVTRHLFALFCTCLAEDFESVLALVGEIVQAPTIANEELAIRKGEVVTGLRQDEDNPAVRAVERLMSLLYGPDHPYGRRAKGTIESVEGLTRSGLQDLHSQRFVPSQLTAVVVGDVDTTRIVDIASSVFGSWTAPPSPPPTLPPVARGTERRRITIPMMNKSQTEIAYGFTTMTRDDPQYYAFSLMNNVFGQYALGGRLGDSIRERQGMAYHVSSTLDANILPGPLVVRAGVNAANVDRAIASIDAEVAALRRDGVTAKELDESRQYLIGAMPRQLETNAGIAQFLQTAEFFGLGLDYDVRLPEYLRAVTLEDVHAVAQKYLDIDTATMVVAGPYAE